MNNPDLVWRLVELILEKEKKLNQVALDKVLHSNKPISQEHNED